GGPACPRHPGPAASEQTHRSAPTPQPPNFGSTESTPHLTLSGSGLIRPFFSSYGLSGFSFGQLRLLLFRFFCALLNHSALSDLSSGLDPFCGLLSGVGAARLCYSLRHIEQFPSLIDAQVEPIREVVHGRAGQLFDRLDAVFSECGAVTRGDAFD